MAITSPFSSSPLLLFSFLQILSLFERFPLGLLPGHFFALLRLASWVQRGEAPSKAMLFTQVSPPKVGLKTSGPVQPPPARHVSTSPRRTSYSSPKASKAVEAANVDSMAKSPQIKQQSATPAAATTAPAAFSIPPPVPDDSTKPANPFRQHHAHPAGTSSSNMLGSAILGFDPAPNLSKQTKPKLVRPTPIVADASTSVLGAPSIPVVDPFRSGASAGGSSVNHSPVSGRSVFEEPSGPPLPPRPIEGLGAELRPPPPLPPRHISPLIQAGLNARREVKSRKEALPPKTFTVLQSTSDKHPLKETPRLLTGQAAPPPPSSYTPKKKSLPGSEPRRSIVDLAGMSATSVAGGGQGTKSVVEHPSPKNRVGPLPPTIAPKPSYVGKGKEGVPAWLREQEHLQRSSPLDHHNSSVTAPSDRVSSCNTRLRSKKRTTSAAHRIEFLDNESDEEEESGGEDTMSEQAKSAASIDRNNPFFQHSRDANKRGVDLKETLSKLAVENAVAKAERDSKYKANSDNSTAHGASDHRPLGRSKTMRDGSRNGASGPPLVPPRRKMDNTPATLDSGTYPGFGKSARVEGPTVGGLRQTPISKKADVGLPASVLAEREKMEKEKVEKMISDSSSRSTPVPPPPRRTTSFSSQISLSDSSATTPLSPKDGTPPSSINATSKTGQGIRERVSELLKGDLTALSERHDWLARAAERAKGGPLNDARVGLMDDRGDDGDDDAPEVDDDYLEEVRRQQRRQQRYSTIDMVGSNGMAGNDDDDDRATPISRNRPSPGPTQRRATDSFRKSMSGVNAAIVRRSSLLARGSIFHDAQGDDKESALDIDNDGVGPDVDTGHHLRSLESLKEDSQRARVSPAKEQLGWQQLP